MKMGYQLKQVRERIQKGLVDKVGRLPLLPPPLQPLPPVAARAGRGRCQVD